MHAKLFKCLPVFNHHVGVYQRCFHVQFEIRLLLFRHLWHQIRNQHVITRHNGVLTTNAMHFPVAQVADNNTILYVGGVNHRAVQAQTRGVFRQVQFFIMQSGEDRVLHGGAR